MRKTTSGLLLIAMAAAAAGGCTGRLIKEGAGVALGAKGLHTVLQDESSLVGYGAFEVGAFTDGFGGRTPGELFSLLPGDIHERIAKSKRLSAQPPGKTAVIRGQVLYYENAQLLGQALGPLEEVVARVELVDKATGTPLGLAVCVGRTDASVNSGVKTKADGLAKGIVAWIESRYPKVEGEK